MDRYTLLSPRAPTDLFFVDYGSHKVYVLGSTGFPVWSYKTDWRVYSSPAIGPDKRLYIGSYDKRRYAFYDPTPTPTPTPTPIPNYVNLTVSPTEVSPGTPVTLSSHCDFTRWNYEGTLVNIYLAAIKEPAVADAPSSVADALAGGTVYLFGPKMESVYVYNGTLDKPTISGVTFPPFPTTGTISIATPEGTAFAGDYVFATASARGDTGQFMRDDGLPVENSNKFAIQ